MIPSFVIRQFFDRELDSHEWVKALSRKQLLAATQALRPQPNLYPDMRTHQLGCFLLGVSYPGFGLWLDMGTGKTLIALELLKYWQQIGRLRRAIIFITSDKAFPTWEKQIHRFKINLPYVLLEGSSAEKWRTLEEFGDGLILVSYPGAVSMVSRTVRKKDKNKWVLDPALVARFSTNVDGVVADESTKASGNSLTFDLVERLTRSVKICYALAGRPFGRDPMKLWPQYYLFDRGETLGRTLGLFRAAFFTEQNSYWNKYAREYKFKDKLKPALARMLQHRSIAYAASECIDLPDFVPLIEEVQFPQEAQSYYDVAVKSIIESAQAKNKRAVKNVFLRMRQLSSGFVGFRDDETGERAEIEFADNPKFDRLMELLEELPADRKAVVFYAFTFSGRKIAAAAKELGLKPIWLWSGTKDYRRDLHNFENDPNYRLAVVNNQVGAFSLDGLQIANYLFMYESPVSVIDREQAERRLRRQGQVRKVLQYDLIVKGSMDAKVLQFHREGESLMNALLRNPIGVLDGRM